MAFFEHVLTALWAMRPGNPVRFWLVWSTITAGAATAVAAALGGEVPVPAKWQVANRAITFFPIWRQFGTAKAVAALTLMAVFLAFFITMTLAGDDFAYYDHSIFILSTLKGHDWPLYISRGDSRFLPLALQEFNLIRHFTDTITGYHVWPLAQLLIFCWVLLILDDELGITARVALAIFTLLTPGIFLSFSELIYPERDVLFFLACLVLCVRRFEQTLSVVWAVAAAVCAQFMVYYKEPAFLLLFGFAASRLMFRLRNARHRGSGRDPLWDKESRLDLCLVVLAVLFLLYYFAEIGVHPNMGYARGNGHPLPETVLAYIKTDWLAWVLLAIVLARIYLILRHRVAPSPLWDGLAVGAVLYFFAFLYLRLFTVYYLAPVDLIAVLYGGRFAVLSWGKMRSRSKIAISVVVLAVLLQGILLSAWIVFSRKNSIRAKVEIASLIETRYRLDAVNAVRLFFPFGSRYDIEQFACFLNYQGVPAEGVCGAGKQNSVFLAIPNDRPGAGWISLGDQTVSGPHRGDLVIVLPDDDASLAQAAAYRERGEPLFSYAPRPAIPHWLYSVVGNLRLLGDFTLGRQTPLDRWDGSVTLWK